MLGFFKLQTHFALLATLAPTVLQATALELWDLLSWEWLLLGHLCHDETFLLY